MSDRNRFGWKQETPMYQMVVIRGAIAGYANNIQENINVKGSAERIEQLCEQLAALEAYISRDPFSSIEM